MMDVKRAYFKIVIEFDGNYLVTESNNKVEVYSDLAGNAWDALEHFNDNLTGHLSSSKINVYLNERPWIDADRRNNP